MKFPAKAKTPWLLLAAFLLVSPVCTLTGAEPHPERIAGVIGLLSINGSPRVVVQQNGTPSKWLEEGMEYRGNTIVSINLSTNLVTIKGSDGSLYTLPLNTSKIVVGDAAPGLGRAAMRMPDRPRRASSSSGETVVYELYPPKGTPVRVDDLDFAWINSDANPMKNNPINPAGREMLKWREMKPEEKDVFIETYRQCGWAVTVHDTNKGVGFSGTKLSPPQ